MLGSSRDELAAQSKVSAATLADFEASKRRPYSRTLVDLRRAFEAAGVEFIIDIDGLRLTSVTDGACAVREPIDPDVGPGHRGK